MTTALMTQTHLNHLSIPDLMSLGKILVGTGFLPDSIKTPEQACAIMIRGQELAIPPMYALSNIAVIKGKPTLSAELMLALIYRDHGDDAITFTAATNERATISYKRRNAGIRQTFTFSLEDAKTAGLAGSATWKSYPGALLRARCISAVARMAFADSIGGMYTPEELGATVSVDAEGGITIDGTTGEIIDSQPQPPAQAQQTPPPSANTPKCPTHPTRTPRQKEWQGKQYYSCTGKMPDESWCNWQVPVNTTPTIGAPAGKPPAAYDGAGAPAGGDGPMYGSAPPEQAPAAPEPTQTAQADRGAVTAAAIARIEAAGSLAEIAGIKADLKRAGGLNLEQAAEIGKAFARQEADLSLIEQAPA